MIRRILSLLVIAAIAASCGNTGNKEANSVQSGAGNDVKIEFASLAENPDNYIGKTIAVEGKVVHVCTESGKKLFIVGNDPDVRLYIQAGETMPKFPMELLGSTVVVEGLVTKPVATAMTGEGMAHAEGAVKMNGDSCETEKALASQTSLSDIVMEYKSHIVKQ